MRRLRPAAVDAADQFGFTVKRRFPGTDHVRAKVGVRASGLKRQRLGRVVFGVYRRKGFKPFFEVLFVPCQQDGLLVGAGTYDDAQPGDILCLHKRVDRTGGFHVEAK